MAPKFRSTYDLMDWTATQFDLNPAQRKELYEILEKKGILESKSPDTQAVKIAREMVKGAAKAARNAKGSKAFAASRRPVRSSEPSDDLEEESEGDDSDYYDDFGPEVGDEEGGDGESSMEPRFDDL